MFAFNYFWTAKVTHSRFCRGARELGVKHIAFFTYNFLKFAMKIILFQ